MKHGPKQLDYQPGLMAVGAGKSALDEPVIDLRGFFSILWRGKWIVAICVLIFAALAYVVVSQFEPRYRASGKVMFDLEQSNVSNLEGLLSNVEYDSDALQGEIEVLRSTALMERVIDALALDENPDFNPALREEELSLSDYILSYIPIDIDGMLQSYGLRSPPPVITDEERAAIQRRGLIQRLRYNLSLAPVGRSRVIEISYTAGKAQLAADVVNMVAEQYIVDQLEARLETTQKATAWINEQVTELRGKLSEAEDKVADARERLALDSGQASTTTRQQIEGANRSLTNIRERVAALEAQYVRLSEALETGADLGSLPEFRTAGILQSYREREVELVTQQRTLRQTVREGHPALVRLNTQLEELKGEISNETRRILNGINIELSAARSEETTLRARLSDLENLSLRQSRDDLELGQLEREADASRQLYETLLNRQREVSATIDTVEADVRVLSPAYKPLAPESQRQRAIMMAACALGAVFGVFIILLLDFLNNTFRAPAQLEGQTGLTVLGSIPAGGFRKKPGGLINQFLREPNSSLAEAIRNLRTSILFSNIDQPPKVVMFTSSLPKEGKSTTSMLMALTSNQMGKSTILVDCDLRRPAVADMLGMNNDPAPGLLSVMQGTALLEDAIYREPESGLHVLMTKDFELAGKLSAADILASNRFKDLIKILSDTYDTVILDTPPALVVADARIMSSVADAMIYVVRWDKTARGAVTDGLKELQSVDAPIIGTAITMINEAKAARYTYDGYEYHKGKHREYYAK